MAFPQGRYFRATNNQVDPANCSAETSTSANYPTTSAQGNNVGWETIGANSPTGINRDITTDVRLRGIQYWPDNVTSTYRIDLPSAGSYNIRAAFGDSGSAHGSKAIWKDTTTVLGTINTGASDTPSNQWLDASGVVRTSESDWVNNNAVANFTFATTIFRVDMGGNTAASDPNNTVNFIYIEAAGGGGSTGTVAKTNANDTSAASGTTTILGTLAKTNANDTLSASGTTTVIGTLAKTNANDTVVASGSTGQATGTVAYTNANDTSAASGTTTVTGALARTNANDTCVASGVAATIANATPGHILYTPSQVRGESDEAKRARRIREGTIAPDPVAQPVVKADPESELDAKAAKLRAARLRIQEDSARLRARIEVAEAKQQRTAAAERNLMRQRQALQLKAAEEAFVVEQLEVMDVAFVAMTVIRLAAGLSAIN